MDVQTETEICNDCDKILNYLNKQSNSILVTTIIKALNIPTSRKEYILRLLENNGHVKSTTDGQEEVSATDAKRHGIYFVLYLHRDP